jgi:hypothetical protein
MTPQLALDWVRHVRADPRTRRIQVVLRAVFYPCALALVAFMGVQAARDTKFETINFWPLAGAYLAALVWWGCLAFGWASLVADDITLRPVTAWCRTQVARYIPGGIWAAVARATTVRGRVRDKFTAVTAENVLVLLGSLTVAGLWAAGYQPQWLLLSLLVVASVAAARWLERRSGITRRRAHRSAVSYLVGFVAYGIMSVLVQVAVSGPRPVPQLAYVAGAACVAWAVGLVVVLAPGGVGVREVVYVWMLIGLFPRTGLEAAAVTSRLVTVLAELTALALAYHWDHFGSGELTAPVDAVPASSASHSERQRPT